MKEKLFGYWEALLVLAEKHPELAGVIIASVVWPAVTGAASFAYGRAEERFPFAVAFLRRNGLDLAGCIELIRKHWPKRLPPPPPFPMVLFALAFASALVAATGCGGAQELAKYAEAGRDLAVVAEPCLVAAKDEAIARCEDEECRREVVDRFAPIADALDVMHETWCTVSPESEGC